MTKQEFDNLQIGDYIMHNHLKYIYKIVGKTSSLVNSIYYQIYCVSSDSIVNVAVMPNTWKKLSQLDKVKFL